MTRFLWILLPILSVSLMAADTVVYPPLNEELIPENEAAEIAGLTKGTEMAFLASQKEGATATRDAHAKHHGCVHAKLDVLPGLKGDLKQGIFASEQSYKAWIRYSNGTGKVQPDFIPDGRGMAVKVVGVDGDREVLQHGDELHTQDFLMINFPQFFVKNTRDYIGFVKDQKAFMATHEEERKIATAIGTQIVTSPLENIYFSMTPILMGKRAIKFRAMPCVWKNTIIHKDLDLRPMIKILTSLKSPEDLAAKAKDLLPYAGYLRQVMKTQLEEGDACYQFAVQFQENNKTEPVENPMVEWKTEFHDVARISIEKQSFDSKEQHDFCENLTLTPWHALKAHRPIGGIQRARKPIYEVISRLRHEHNKVEQKEPTGDERF